MNKKLLAMTVTFISSAIIVLFLFHLLGNGTPAVSVSAQTLSQAIPTVTIIEPASAPNDLDTVVNITGTGFTAGLSETVVITQTVVWLGDLQLSDATWVSTTLITATVPWGMDPGVYTLTVVISDNAIASLPEASTVTEGINVWATGGPYGGRIYNFAFGESGYQTIYAMANDVGLFRSRTGGDSWELVINETGPDSYVSVDPTNPNRIFVSKRNKGLYCSEDGGDTWTLLPLPIPDIPPGRIRAFVNPQDGTLFGALSSLDCGGGCGLFRYHEADQTWQLLETSGVLSNTTGVTSVGFDPDDPQIIYAGLFNGVVIKSLDGGQVWTSLGQTPIGYIGRLFVNPIGGHEPWVCGSAYDGQEGGLFKYSGGSWVTVFAPDVSDLVFDPAATDSLHQAVWLASNQGVFHSIDGGQSWTNLPPGFFGVQAILLNPANPQVIYANYYSEGVIATHDGGASWQWHNQGLAGLVPRYMAVNPDDPRIVYAYVGTGIYGSRNGGGAWEQLTNDTGGPIVVDPANPQHVVSTGIGRLIIADDGWHFNRQVAIPLPAGMSDQVYTPLVRALIAKPNFWLMGVGYWNPQLQYMNFAGGGGIYTSTDGESWTITELALTPHEVTNLGFDPIDAEVLYAGTNGSGDSGIGNIFFKSTDSGQTWQSSNTGLYDNRWGGTTMAIEPTPPYRIFLGNGGGLYVSTDQGASWSRTNTPADPFYAPFQSLLYIQTQPPVLYGGSMNGLYKSSDGAHSWQRAQGTLGQLEIRSMAGVVTSDRQVFYAATAGGMTNNSQAQGLNWASSDDVLVNAGVYRNTTLLLNKHIYLPFVFR